MPFFTVSGPLTKSLQPLFIESELLFVDLKILLVSSEPQCEPALLPTFHLNANPSVDLDSSLNSLVKSVLRCPF